MTAVNLVPEELKLSHRRRRRLRVWVTALSGLLIVAVALSYGRYLTYARQQRALRRIEQQCQTVEQEIQTLQNAQDELARWQSRLALLRELAGYANLSVATAFLARESPALAYLEELRFEPREKSAVPAPASGGSAAAKAGEMFQLRSQTAETSLSPNSLAPANLRLHLRGRAATPEAVAEYLLVLRAADLFGDVRLLQVRRAAAGGGEESVQFEIEADLLAGRSTPPGIDYADLPTTTSF